VLSRSYSSSLHNKNKPAGLLYASLEYITVSLSYSGRSKKIIIREALKTLINPYKRFVPVYFQRRPRKLGFFRKSIPSRRFLQPENASSPRVVRPSGRVIVVRLLQPQNALFPMALRLPGRVMDTRLLQFSNALSPIMVRPAGRVMDVRFPQPQKAPFLIEVRPAGRVRDSRHIHLLNAQSPMVVTLSGISMAARLEPINAPFPITVTLGGMVKAIRLLQ
jgi:hypothetical protein